MKRILRKFQQGDVVMHQVTDETYNKVYDKNVKSSNQERKRVCQYKGNSEDLPILALGEATGHHHSIDVMHEENADCEIINWYNSWGRFNSGSGQDLGKVPEYVEVKNAPATIKHQEHEPITLPIGIYRIRIVKEYDPFSNTTRGVAD